MISALLSFNPSLKMFAALPGLKKCVLAVGLAVSLCAAPLSQGFAATASAKTSVQKKAAQKKAVKKTTAGKTTKSSVKTAAARTKARAQVKTVASRSVGKKSVRTSLRKPVNTRRAVTRRHAPSQATLAGLRTSPDPLMLGSSVAFAIDQDTGEELFSKNADIELPIASVTKLMTALVIADSGLNLSNKIRITREDYVRSTASSKLRNGMTLTRADVMRAALMSSDNRAASALARTYPGGRAAFVVKMNEMAERLGMTDSAFADPAGLDNRNHSTARDLAKLVAAAHEHRVIREASTAPSALLNAGRFRLAFQTTNRLIGNPDWQIGVQKTGFTTAAGRCMVVQSEFADRRVVMVLLDSPSSAQRASDMTAMRRYVENEDLVTRQFDRSNPYELF